MKKILLTTIVSLTALLTAQAQFVDWTGNGTDGAGNLWADDGNWNTTFPNSNTVDARFNLTGNVQINVTGDYTARSYLTGFAANVTNPEKRHLVYGAGTLTIDINNASNDDGISNLSNNDIKLQLTSDITINNSLASGGVGVTFVRNGNGSANILEFGSACDLTLTTRLQTTNNTGSIVFNCNFAPSSENLFIGSNNVSFGADHSSNNFGKDIVLFANAKLAVDGGTVLNNGRKFQVNGSGAELELNGADAINGANVVVGGSNALLLDVNANQGTMGDIRFSGGAADGVLTIDVDPAVTNLAFVDCAALDWASGTVTITGFQENTIRFGTDENGLTATQLAAINGGAYTLSPTGFLTTGVAPLEVPIVSVLLDPYPKISFPTENGQSYQLQKSSTLSPPSWEDIDGESVVGDGNEQTLEDTAGGPPGETKAFYRVVVS